MTRLLSLARASRAQVALEVADAITHARWTNRLAWEVTPRAKMAAQINALPPAERGAAWRAVYVGMKWGLVRYARLCQVEESEAPWCIFRAAIAYRDGGAPPAARIDYLRLA